ncbi:Recombination-associated protein RdgC [Symbiodinium microadriaticum]|uniref:site-specific DNA-methyltransferase (adenine-specific) n=1 Tax=Symbiodinium microadriaticum TaxID=2951 RepID=A0A1Q9BX98_SYMMI|nr:Recombination-associated protein RdgC [Symbiodinium microadriaticum]
MAQLKLALPKGARLIEPFCGSGAVMMNTAYSNYVLADINADVINTYDTIRNAAESVIAALSELYATCRTREHYDAIRKEFNERTAEPVRMAAMFIYMNRHGYRGLCRYNKRKGEFNVPWGDYRKPYLPEKEIRYMADRLANVDLLCAGYEETLKLAGEGDVVYCDPPYVNPGKFTGYHASGFSEAQQRELVGILNTLPEKGVHVVASSHDAENIREMYDMARTGWVSPLGEEYEELTHQANGLILLTQRNESKIIPPATVKELVRQRVTKLEKEQNRRLKRTEISALNDLVLGELLPKALSKYANMNMWIDPKSRLIIVDTTSFKRAEDAAALLRKTLGTLPIIPFTLETPVELKLTEWVRSSELPPGLALCDEATLEAILEDGGVVTTKRQDLVCDEIANHIEAGKLVTKLAMSWMEQLNFVINDSFVISRLNFADALIEQNDDIDREDEVQRFDADFVLFTGVIMELLDQLIAAFGGEAKSSTEADGGDKEEGDESGEAADNSELDDDE